LQAEIIQIWPAVCLSITTAILSGYPERPSVMNRLKVDIEAAVQAKFDAAMLLAQSFGFHEQSLGSQSQRGKDSEVDAAGGVVDPVADKSETLAPKIVGKSLRAFRLEAGLSQAKLAEELGFNARTVGRHETGVLEMREETLSLCGVFQPEA
jgi:DNA-binding XRE family transcriptional regulator